MSNTAAGHRPLSKEGKQYLEINADGTYFQVGDPCKSRIRAEKSMPGWGEVYVLMDGTNQTKLIRL